jgi:two-component SAPR family response regulator
MSSNLWGVNLTTLAEVGDQEIDLNKYEKKQQFMQKLFDTVEEVQDQLSPGEYDFFEQMNNRWTEYGMKMFLSEAQWRWLWKIACKYCPEVFP